MHANNLQLSRCCIQAYPPSLYHAILMIQCVILSQLSILSNCIIYKEILELTPKCKYEEEDDY